MNKLIDFSGNLLKYGFIARRPKFPPILTFNVTTKCNMKCRHCMDDCWGDPENDLSLDEIKNLSASLGQINILGLGGGEPSLRDDLVAICELFLKNNGVKHLSIPSNGFDTDRICVAVQKIMEIDADFELGLMLSIDGLSSTHDSLRRQGSFERTLKTARKLMLLKEKFNNLNLSFLATIHNCNYRELPELAKFLYDEFKINLECTILSGNPRDKELMLPPVPEIERTLDEVYASRESSKMQSKWMQIYREIRLSTEQEGRQIIPCRASSLIGTIYANGDVNSCPYLPSLGNLREKSFNDIWHGENALKQFDSIKNCECSCNDSCYIIQSLQYYWKLPFLLLVK